MSENEQNPIISFFVNKKDTINISYDLINIWKNNYNKNTAIVENITDKNQINRGDATIITHILCLDREWGEFTYNYWVPLLIKNKQWDLLSIYILSAHVYSKKDFQSLINELNDACKWMGHLGELDNKNLTLWDNLLITNIALTRNWYCNVDRQERMIVLAEQIEKLPKSLFNKKHKKFTKWKNKDIWLWLWCASPTTQNTIFKLEHLQFLLSIESDVNIALEVEGGFMSAGSAILWDLNIDRNVPNLVLEGEALPLFDCRVVGKEFYDFYHNIDTQHWVHIRCNALLFKVNNIEISHKPIWLILNVMKQFGMDMEKLVEPSNWGIPLLGMLEYNEEKNLEFISNIENLENIRELGFSLNNFKDPSKNILATLSEENIFEDKKRRYNFLVFSDYFLNYDILKQYSYDDICKFILSTTGTRVFLTYREIIKPLIDKYHQLIGKSIEGEDKLDFEVFFAYSLTKYLNEHIQSSNLDFIEKVLINIVKLMLEHAQHQFTEQKDEYLKDVYLTSKDIATLKIIVCNFENNNIKESEREEQMSKIVFICYKLYLSAEYKNLFDKTLLNTGEHYDLTQLFEQLKTQKNTDQDKYLLCSDNDLDEFIKYAENNGKSNEAIKNWFKKIIDDNNLTDRAINIYRPKAMASSALEAINKLRDAFPHFEDIVNMIEKHLLLESKGSAMFTLPPLLMVGPPGTGKTFFFQELASYVNTTYSILNMGNMGANWYIVGMENGWANATPGKVFETLINPKNTINPIFLLDEIDKVSKKDDYPITPSLLSLLEPHSAKKFQDNCVPLKMDASKICWVATANDLSLVDKPLVSRFNVLKVPNPDYHARLALAKHIYSALRKNNSWGQYFDDTVPMETLDVLVKPSGSARDLRKNIMEGLANCAKENRKILQPQDIHVINEEVVKSPWDININQVLNLKKAIG